MPDLGLELPGGARLEIVEGDITALELDAIVNAANSSLQLGAGVAGAIRRRGGSTIQAECDRIGHCPVGGAVITGGGELPARHVIHAVGPVWGRQSEAESDRLLAAACREALNRAAEHGLGAVALPALSSGVFGYPVDRSARILLGEARAFLDGENSLRRVVFCLFGAETFDVFREVLDALRQTEGS
jgi:O-acetyl-ADP-ribose deacetylase (regulator of RNase III)